jgi:hypothetical protein
LKALRIFTALLLVFFLLNYFSRKKLPFAYADVADYSLLYTTANSFYVKKLEVVDDSLEILFNGDAKTHKASWRYSKKEYGTDSGTFSFTGNRLRYKPGNPQVITFDDRFSMNISHEPGALPYEVTSANIPIEPALVRDVKEWTAKAWMDDKRIKWLAVEAFVSQNARIENSDNTIEKILKIGQLVLAGMPPDSGKPSAETSALHPLDQYRKAKAGQINLWCGNYAAIFNCFATSIDIPVRTVFTGTSKDQLGLGNHVFSEAYIKEEDCWAYVDLTSNTVLLKRGDRYLNVIDVQRLLRYPGATGEVSSYSVVGDTIQTVPFDSMSANARYYFNQNTFFTFFYKSYFSQYANPDALLRISNLFDTKPWYAVYSDNLPGRNYHNLARVISNYLFVITLGAWLILLSLFILQKIKMIRAHR